MTGLESPSELTYDELEEKYKNLIYKFAVKYKIPGYGVEDLKQELRLVLLKAKERHMPTKSKMVTYLYTAFDNKMHQLYRNAQGFQKCVPDNKLVRVSSMDETNEPVANENEDEFELLEGLSREAKLLGQLIFSGHDTEASWKTAGLSQKEIDSGREELKGVLTSQEA